MRRVAPRTVLPAPPFARSPLPRAPPARIALPDLAVRRTRDGRRPHRAAGVTTLCTIEKMNNVKVFGLMALLTGLFAAVGGAIGGSSGIVIALLLAGGMNLFAYWNSAQMVLRMYGAQTVSPARARPRCTRWWTACASAPGCPCPWWPWRRTRSPTPSPRGAIRRTPLSA